MVNVYSALLCEKVQSGGLFVIDALPSTIQLLLMVTVTQKQLFHIRMNRNWWATSSRQVSFPGIVYLLIIGS